MLELRKNTVAELLRLSPMEKREAAAWLREERGFPTEGRATVGLEPADGPSS